MSPDVVEVPVRGSDRPALIDWIFADRVLKHTWRVSRHPHSGRVNGAVATIGGKGVWLHRFVLGANEACPAVDHVNRDTLDCRHNNLRYATGSQNQYNRLVSPNSKSGFKGVTQDRDSGLWVAGIYVDKQYKRLGLFTTKKAAARAYDNAARAHHGPFARMNFPRAGERSALHEDARFDKLRLKLKESSNGL